MSTDALELALALHQSPIQRFSLRDRPLPKNICEALQLASSMQPQLQMAAARFLESEETIVEAVRFYLQQVLFEPGTDAYRILGLQPTAEVEQIRQHHIWLQRWLHPDRRGGDWEAVLATKVNWAWQQLRNDASRTDYDRKSREAVVFAKIAQEPSATVQPPSWQTEPVEKSRPHWMRRVLIAGFALGCIGLVYLAATRQDRVDPYALASQSIDSRSTIQPRIPFEQRPGSIVESARAPTIPNEPVAAPVDDEDSGPQAVAANPVSQSLPLPTTNNTKDEGSAPRTGSPAKDEAAVAVSGSPPARPAPSREGELPVESRVVARDTPPDSAPAVQMFPARPQRKGADVASVSTLPAAQDHSLRSRPTLADSQRKAPMTDETSKRVIVAVASPAAQPANAAAIVVERSNEAEPATRVPAANAIVQRTVSSTVIADALATPANRSSEAAVTDVAMRTSDEVQPASEDLNRETLVRFELARDRVRHMVSYFRDRELGMSRGGDDGGQSFLERERNAILARSGQPQVESFVLDLPTWRITHSSVALEATYHVDAKQVFAESGRFNLDMAWRDGDWKVTRIEVLPGR